MIAFLMLSLALCVAVTVGAMAALFVSEAFAPSHHLATHGGPAAWAPPSVSGSGIRDWARRTARQAAAKELRAPAPGGGVAAAVLEGAAQAMRRLAAKHGEKCPSGGGESLRVTAAEALALAEQLRTQPDAAEQAGAKAKENAARLASGRTVDWSAAGVMCPLLTGQGTCSCFDCRPLGCRQHEFLQGTDEDEARDLAAVQVGAEEGLRAALADAGLDAQSYDLNRALVVALNTPHAAERWAAGEAVFQGGHTA